MQIKDTGLAFGVVTIMNHWIGAILMVSFVILSVSTLLLDGAAEPDRQSTTSTLGFLCLILFSFRIYWRIKHYHPLPLGGTSPIEVIISRCVSSGLILAGVILPVLHWAFLSAGGRSFLVFGLDFPGISPTNQSFASILSALYWLGITAFCLGLMMHILGALKHQFLLKEDSILRLMGKKVEL